ncbi:MAG: hypothetical protein WC244_00830 [Patescibacteria group bacterium]
MNKMLENMKRKKWRIIMVVFVVALFLFSPLVNVQAEYKLIVKSSRDDSGKTMDVWQEKTGNTVNTQYRYEDGTVKQFSSPANSGDTTYSSDFFGNLIEKDSKTGTTVTTDPATGKSTTSTSPGFGTIVGNLLGWLIYMIAVAAGWIVSALVYAMLSVMSYPINTHLDAVTNGWKVIRDLCNNFFIVILIAIAIGTIIKIPQWQIKELLPKLLVMAILINFSKMFCGLMIDVSQVLMLAFAAPLQGITGGNIILSALGIPDMYNLMGGDKGSYMDYGAANTSVEGQEIGFGNVITALVYALIASVVAAAVLVAIIAILIYRIVVLLFLTVLSPLPFLLTTFKKGEQYASQWWTEMSKNLIVGPIMLFFLWISFVIMGFSGNTTKNQDANVINGLGASNKIVDNTSSTKQMIVLSNAMSTEGIINFALVIGMLVASLVMGQKTGAVGASWAGSSLSFLNKARKGAQAMPWRATKGIGRGVGAVGGAIATGINDRLLIGEGLARTGFKLANKVPLARTLLSRPFARMTANMKSARTKRNEETARNAALVNRKRIEDMTAEELVAMAEKGNIDQQMAVAPELIRRVIANPTLDKNLENRANQVFGELFTKTNLNGANSKIIGDLKDKYFRHQARALDTTSKKDLREGVMSGTYDIDKAVRKIDTGGEKEHGRLQKLFDTFMLEPDEQEYKKNGKKADINSFIRYMYGFHDADPKALANTLAQFQDEGIKEIIRKQLDFGQLRSLLTVDSESGLVDKDNTLTIGNALLKNRLVGTEQLSHLVYDSSSDKPMNEESRDILADLVTQNASEISSRIKERISEVKQLEKAGKGTEAGELRAAIQKGMADIYENVSDVCGASTMKTIRGSIEDQKVLSKKAFVDATMNRAQRLDEHRKEYAAAHNGIMPSMEEFDKNGNALANYDAEYKRLTDNFGLGGEHVSTGSTKVDLIAMAEQLAERKKLAETAGDFYARTNYDADMKILEDKMVGSFIGGLSVSDFGNIQMGPPPAEGDNKGSMASALKLVQSFTLKSNGAKLYNYRRNAAKHKSNEAATNLLWNAIGSGSNGKKADELSDAELEVIREKIMKEFKIKKGMYGYVDAGDSAYLKMIQIMLKALQDNPEVWENFKPKQA